MFQMRHIVAASKNLKIPPLRHISSATSRIQSAPPPFPIVATCPSPTCAYAETPVGLDVDRKRDLNGSMAPYKQQVVISTGQSDWTSRIEDDGQGTPWGDLARKLKAMLGRGGKYSDPLNNVMITNSSFMDPEDGQRVLVFPSFKSVLLPDVSDSVVEQFIQEFLLPETLHPMHDALSTSQKKALTRVPGAFTPPGVSALQKPLILICGHNSRDSRCGVMGPLLHSEFVRHLSELGVKGGKDTVDSEDEHADGKQPVAQVGLISHIGGHKWAGNVIVYLPSMWTTGDTAILSEEQREKASPLAGYGVWYGRVEPKHVEGIIKETIWGGRVIKELFRGSVGPNSEFVRLPLER